MKFGRLLADVKSVSEHAHVPVQLLEGQEMLNMRWAHEDPNPVARIRVRLPILSCIGVAEIS